METNQINLENIKSKINQTINKTRQEVEELALQFSLSKAEAADKFEEIKKEFHARIKEWKSKLQEEESPVKDAAQRIETLLEELQIQLELGKAEAKDYFEKQKTGILNAVDKIENELQSHPRWNSLLSDLRSESEKLKLKFEILQLKFELKKFRITDDFKSAMREVQAEASKVLDKAGQKWDATKSKYTDFNDEMSLVYKHLKKAIKSL